MKTIWKNGLTAEQKKEVEAIFQGSHALRERLTTILEGKVSSAVTESTSKSSYEDPNWAFRQADNVGYRRALQEILSILKD